MTDNTLSARFPLVPIANETDYDRAITIIDELLDKEPRSKEEDEYLDRLGDLIGDYEDVHYPIPDASAADVLEHLMDTNSLSVEGLAFAVRLQPTYIAEILDGSREMTEDDRARFSREFHVTEKVFLPNEPNEKRKSEGGVTK